jgi:hypothetical protein
MTDAELVEAARRGDAASLGLLLERYRAPHYGLALRMLGHGQNAQDAVHDTFLVALRKLDLVRDPAAVGGWLHSILRNVCRMQLRARQGELLSDEMAQSRPTHTSASRPTTKTSTSRRSSRACPTTGASAHTSVTCSRAACASDTPIARRSPRPVRRRRARADLFDPPLLHGETRMRLPPFQCSDRIAPSPGPNRDARIGKPDLFLLRKAGRSGSPASPWIGASCSWQGDGRVRWIAGRRVP